MTNPTPAEMARVVAEAESWPTEHLHDAATGEPVEMIFQVTNHG